MNSDVTDTFTYELWLIHFLRVFAFIQKLCLPSFHFSKINKGELEYKWGLENFSKINKRGTGNDYLVLESTYKCSLVTSNSTYEKIVYFFNSFSEFYTNLREWSLFSWVPGRRIFGRIMKVFHYCLGGNFYVVQIIWLDKNLDEIIDQRLKEKLTDIWK